MEIFFRPLVLKRKGVGSERYECFSLIEGKEEKGRVIPAESLPTYMKNGNDTKPTDEFRCKDAKPSSMSSFERIG
jgi:hypothetical protein